MKYERHLGKGESLCCEYNHVVCDVCQMRLAEGSYQTIDLLDEWLESLDLVG